MSLDTNGEAVVEMPEWFGTLNRDFRLTKTASRSKRISPKKNAATIFIPKPSAKMKERGVEWAHQPDEMRQMKQRRLEAEQTRQLRK